MEGLLSTGPTPSSFELYGPYQPLCAMLDLFMLQKIFFPQSKGTDRNTHTGTSRLIDSTDQRADGVTIHPTLLFCSGKCREGTSNEGKFREVEKEWLGVQRTAWDYKGLSGSTEDCLGVHRTAW